MYLFKSISLGKIDLRHKPSCTGRVLACLEYEAKWPKYCQTCYGSGGWVDGGSRDEPPDLGPCEDCTDADDAVTHDDGTVTSRCPRCGEHGLRVDVDDVPCPHCQWNWGRSPGDVFPDYDDCDCLEDYPDPF